MSTIRDTAILFCAGLGLVCVVSGMLLSNLPLLIASVFWAVMAVYHKLPWPGEDNG